MIVSEEENIFSGFGWLAVHSEVVERDVVDGVICVATPNYCDRVPWVINGDRDINVAQRDIVDPPTVFVFGPATLEDSEIEQLVIVMLDPNIFIEHVADHCMVGIVDAERRAIVPHFENVAIVNMNIPHVRCPQFVANLKDLSTQRSHQCTTGDYDVFNIVGEIERGIPWLASQIERLENDTVVSIAEEAILHANVT